MNETKYYKARIILLSSGWEEYRIYTSVGSDFCIKINDPSFSHCLVQMYFHNEVFSFQYYFASQNEKGSFHNFKPTSFEAILEMITDKQKNILLYHLDLFV